jgi:hypothetical protein
MTAQIQTTAAHAIVALAAAWLVRRALSRRGRSGCGSEGCGAVSPDAKALRKRLGRR